MAGWAAFVLISLGMAATLLPASGCGTADERLTIALVGPMTGTDPQNGESYLQGVHLCLDRVNREGGVDGRTIHLEVYDDENDPELARQRARQIAEDGRALAVIGHNYTSCSVAGGEVYEAEQIPAISPSSTGLEVTRDNPWYFRTSFNTSLEASFLANYAAQVSSRRQVGVIFETSGYGAELARGFMANCDQLGIEIAHRWGFSRSEGTLEATLEGIVDRIAASGYGGILLMAVQAPEGAVLVRHLRDRGMANRVIAQSGFASKAFQEAFCDLPNEVKKPGFYTDGIFVASPMLFDSAGEAGQRFKSAFHERYGAEDPDWRAAFAHDSALVLVEALRNAGVVGTRDSLAEDRRRIRDYLAGLDTIGEAVPGATGFNYFDANGDTPRPISLGVYRNNDIVSAPTQFQEIPDLAEIPDLEAALQQGRVLRINDRYLYKTEVVYTGLRFESIGDLDAEVMTCALDFHLWFRHASSLPVADIVFSNAVGEAELEGPLEEETVGRVRYSLYRVRGTFRVDVFPPESLEEHVVSVSFRHRDLTRNNLIFVTDLLGMGLKDRADALTTLRRSQVVSPSSSWRAADFQCFQDVVNEPSYGHPRYVDLSTTTLGFSRFNSKVVLRKERIGIRRTLSKQLSRYLVPLSLLIILFTAALARARVLREAHRLRWLLYVIFGSALLLGLEVVIVEILIATASRTYVELVPLIFDIFWWYVPAIFLMMAMETFIWTPLEERAGQTIPNIVRRFVGFMIFLLASFGIIAFVFDQRITSLLATSGVIAMIIGLAIQINISNIFSGIALNLERPFTIGDWIRVEGHDEAKVVDMTWRTTRLQLRDNTILNVPNSIAAESAVVNYHRPDTTYEVWIYFHVDPGQDPERVIKIAKDAMESHPDVLTEPRPGCRFIGYTEWSAEFVAVPVFQEYGKRNVLRGAIMTHLWGELHRAGIRQAIRSHEVHLRRGRRELGEKGTSLAETLDNVDIFRALDDDARAHIAEGMQELTFDAGEAVVTQGEEGDSLFIIAEGAVGVRVAVGESDTIEVDRMGAGTYFGEMALLTGEPRSASIVAVTDCRVFKITKDTIAPLIEASPEVCEILSEELTRREINREAKKSAHRVPQAERESLYRAFLRKINTFFGGGQS